MVAALGACALTLVACAGEDGDEGRGRSGKGSSSPAVTTPSEDDVERNSTVAAVTADGRALILDGQTGETRRLLLEGIQVRDPASNAIAVSSDRRTVFVVRPGRGAEQEAEIVRVSASGGDERVLAKGHSPAVSPDGNTLAYVRLVGGERAAEPPEPTIRLRELDSGDERELRTRQGDLYGIWELAWTRDGSRLAFVAGEVRTAVYVVDADAPSLDAAQRLGPRDSGATWTDVAALDDHRLAVIERCCQLPDPNPERWHVISVDVETGKVGDDVFGRARTEAARLDARSDAEGLLVVEGGGPEGGPLLRSTGSGDLRRIADDIIVAAW